ncbi:C2H2 transcription factor [Stagonosporopsis vannaccii]|nr:C2H2 transcription factor [Stagonosporopsis vannaccii]
MSDLALSAPETFPRPVPASASSAAPPFLGPIEPLVLKHPCSVSGCSRRFETARQLDRHKKNQHKVFACDTCDKTYPHAKNLYEHKLSKHKGESFPCDVQGCTMRVKQKKNLKRHKQTVHGFQV